MREDIEIWWLMCESCWPVNLIPKCHLDVYISCLYFKCIPHCNCTRVPWICPPLHTCVIHIRSGFLRVQASKCLPLKPGCIDADVGAPRRPPWHNLDDRPVGTAHHRRWDQWLPERRRPCWALGVSYRVLKGGNWGTLRIPFGKIGVHLREH